jgi:hypothetical protein
MLSGRYSVCFVFVSFANVYLAGEEEEAAREKRGGGEEVCG